MIIPAVLSVAGSDSGAGAGIQADLRAFDYFGVIGTTAITAVTAQNSHKFYDFSPVPAEMVSKQIEAVFSGFNINAVKTGMLVNDKIIKIVADKLKKKSALLIVDPILLSTTGAELLAKEAVITMQKILLPLATVITPNIPEAEVLLGAKIKTDTEIINAAKQLADKYKTAILLKGGHRHKTTSTDILCHNNKCWQLKTKIIKAKSTHGTGCSLSAAIAATLCYEKNLLKAVCKAKAFLYAALAESVQCSDTDWIMRTAKNVDNNTVIAKNIC